MAACYQPLFSVRSGAQSAEPLLAASVAISDDRQTFTIKLRDRATFADGNLVRSSDVVATLDRIRDPALQSPFASLLTVVKDVSVATPDTVRITTKTAFGELPVVLANPAFGIIDGRVVNDRGTVRRSCQGSGAYRSEEDVAGRTVLVRRAKQGDGPPRITLVVTGDPDATESALRRNRVDVGFVSGDTPADGPGYQPYTAVSFIDLNPFAAPLTDARFREAIVRTLDAAAITREAYGTVAIPLTALVPQYLVGADRMRCVDACGTDVTRARQLVQEVFPNGAPTVTFDYDEGTIPGKVATEVVRQLSSVGITVKAAPHSAEEYAQLLLSGSVQMFRFGWVGQYSGAGAILRPLFASGGELAVFGPVTGVDESLATAEAATDPDAAATAFADAADAVLTKWIAKPVAALFTHWRTRSGVQGVSVSSLGALDLAALRAR